MRGAGLPLLRAAAPLCAGQPKQQCAWCQTVQHEGQDAGRQVFFGDRHHQRYIQPGKRHNVHSSLPRFRFSKGAVVICRQPRCILGVSGKGCQDTG